MKWTAIGALIVAFASSAWADDHKYYEPLSLDPPPKAIEGLRLNDVVEFFKANKYRDAKGKVYFCPLCGLYLWAGFAADHTGTVVVKSYTGKEEVVGLSLQASGFIETTPGNPPENLRDVIAKLSQYAQAVCKGDAEQKAQFSNSFNDRLTKLIYEVKGVQSPYEDDVTLAIDACLFDGLRIRLSASHRLNSSLRQINADISAAERRVWSDTTGKFQVSARYLLHNSREATIVKDDGQQVQVPLAKLNAGDLKWLAATQYPMPEPAETSAKANKTDEIQLPTSRWLNTSYDTTIYEIGEGRWAERDNKAQKVKWQLKETARDSESVELYLADRDQTWRLTATRMEIKKGDRWEWLSNGKWLERDRKQ